jgi:transposase
MGKPRSMSDAQRQAAVALFATGHGRDAVATRLGVSPHAVRALQNRWRIWGAEALMRKPKQTPAYPFELKHAIVQRVLAGETKIALAQEYGLSSPQLIAAWVRRYRAEGDDGLRPKPKGRPTHDPTAPAVEESELERLRRENEYLRAEVAYLGKLRALIAAERR